MEGTIRGKLRRGCVSDNRGLGRFGEMENGTIGPTESGEVLIYMNLFPFSLVEFLKI